ncbi:hypothetical protein VKT23_016190 [Stygiomarasmius scandens]|uniref:Protein-S-isoprenylcysteine O-methyltransferase n=1 Tax=Marasmiellus scandens TaxID=2682957 RepID=A0ABR1IZW9_9AGAR
MTCPNPKVENNKIASPEPKGLMTTREAHFNRLVPTTTFLIEAYLLLVQSYPDHSHFLAWEGLMPSSNLHPLTHTPSTFFFGVLFISFAAWIRYTCYRTLGKHYTFEITLLQDHNLITTGPYSVVRHPGYASYLLYYIGLIFVWCSRGSWVRESQVLSLEGVLMGMGRMFFVVWGTFYTAILIFLMLRVEKEDELLKERFGKQWVEWQRSAPWKLVPGIY